MRGLSGFVVVMLGLSLGCAGRTTTTAAGGANTGGATPPAASASAAAQAGQFTPDSLDPIMKKVGPTNGAMRKAIMSGALMDAASSAQQLATLFGDVEKFWTQYKKQDAMKLAAEARTNASATAGAAAAGDMAKAQMAADSLLGQCKQCHGMYREGDQQTGFRIKPGVLESN
jgi:cytochrome c556